VIATAARRFFYESRLNICEEIASDCSKLSNGPFVFVSLILAGRLAIYGAGTGGMPSAAI